MTSRLTRGLLMTALFITVGTANTEWGGVTLLHVVITVIYGITRPAYPWVPSAMRIFNYLMCPGSATAVTTLTLTVSTHMSGIFRILFYHSTPVSIRLDLCLVHPSRVPRHPPGAAVNDKTVALTCLTTVGVVKLTFQVTIVLITLHYQQLLSNRLI